MAVQGVRRVAPPTCSPLLHCFYTRQLVFMPHGENIILALELPEGGRAQVWAAAESLLMRRLREHLREDRGLPRECLRVLGYWKCAGLRT